MVLSNFTKYSYPHEHRLQYRWCHTNIRSVPPNLTLIITRRINLNLISNHFIIVLLHCQLDYACTSRGTLRSDCLKPQNLRLIVVQQCETIIPHNVVHQLISTFLKWSSSLFLIQLGCIYLESKQPLKSLLPVLLKLDDSKSHCFFYSKPIWAFLVTENNP
jgi:hypothetical protein